MPVQSINFAMNHMIAPGLPLAAFFGLTKQLGLSSVEIRNDLKGNAILNGESAEAVKELAAHMGIQIATINALQRFNEWTEAREQEAIELADYAAACGATALVLVPKNDGTGRANGERQGNLRLALKSLKPILQSRGLLGFVEPLGFEICSLRSKREAADAIAAVDGSRVFRLVHDTFHHHLAGEPELFPSMTGLVHISGVTDRSVSVSDMLDDHRVLIDEHDRIDNVGQIRALLSVGFSGLFSFEPFAPSVHGLADPAKALDDSMTFIRSAV